MSTTTLEMIDSAPLGDDREALRAGLRRDGYLFLRGLLPADTVLDLRHQVLAALARQGWLTDGADPDDARPGPVVRHEAGEGFWDGYVEVQRLEAFHRLAHHPRLLGAVRRVLGDDAFAHPQKIARAAFPGTEFVTQPHQDYRYIQGTQDVLTAWVPLSDCPRSSGGLRVLAGSHRRGLLPARAATGAGGLCVDVADDDPAWAGVDYRAGDVLLFHSLTVHGALPNLTDRLRVSVDYRFQAAAEPIAGPSLTPHYAFMPMMPAWDELAAGWGSAEWATSPAELAVVDFGPAAGPLVVPPSTLLADPESG